MFTNHIAHAHTCGAPSHGVGPCSAGWLKSWQPSALSGRNRRPPVPSLGGYSVQMRISWLPIGCTPDPTLSSRPRLPCVQPERDTPSGLPRNPENQRPEGQRSKAWAHHHAKSNVAGDDARVAEVAIGTARMPRIGPEGAAPHHAGNIIRRLQLFPTVLRFIGIRKGQFVPLLLPINCVSTPTHSRSFLPPRRG